jgi:hypothetical protein
MGVGTDVGRRPARRWARPGCLSGRVDDCTCPRGLGRGLLAGKASKEERQHVLIPYLFWAAAGLVGVLLFLVSGTRTGSDDLAPPVVRIAFWAVFAFMWVVPVIVPLLRTIMWLLSPPIFDKVAQGPDFDR